MPSLVKRARHRRRPDGAPSEDVESKEIPCEFHQVNQVNHVNQVH
ncbi:hypothetical protein [Salana multivorans]